MKKEPTKKGKRDQKKKKRKKQRKIYKNKHTKKTLHKSITTQKRTIRNKGKRKKEKG